MQEIQKLGIDQVSTTIADGFQAAHDFIDENIDDKLLERRERRARRGARSSSRTFRSPSSASRSPTSCSRPATSSSNSAASLASGRIEIESLLASLDSVDFRPVADEVVDEIDALTSKLAAIKPDVAVGRRKGRDSGRPVAAESAST